MQTRRYKGYKPKTTSENNQDVFQKIQKAREEVAKEPDFFETQGILKTIPEKHPKLSAKVLSLIFLVAIVLGAGFGCLGFFLFYPKSENLSSNVTVKKWETTDSSATLSPLTGEELSDPSLSNSPTFCVQIPNGLDGARPQVGLSEAGVIFEAIAESGITRFAAVFQNPTSTIIGPIRSLRTYYLQWDTPFDCTIVHAGGAKDAVAAISSGAYRDLTENYNYMWRGASNSFLNRQWNNLFTSSELLKSFNSNNGFSSSNVSGFTRETKKASDLSRIEKLAKNPLDIDQETDSSVKEITPAASTIKLSYGNDDYFNPTYIYNSETNSYDRFYNSDEPHTSYKCTEDFGEATPETSCGDPVQLSPKVVIAIVVSESRAADGVHESIQTVGSGDAYFFQNGDVVEGKWEKPSINSQITFKDKKGDIVKLAPGQTWISAVPSYGSVEYN